MEDEEVSDGELLGPDPSCDRDSVWEQNSLPTRLPVGTTLESYKVGDNIESLERHADCTTS